VLEYKGQGQISRPETATTWQDQLELICESADLQLLLHEGENKIGK